MTNIRSWDRKQGITHLIGVGYAKGTKAQDAKIGDRVVWNFGIMGEIVAIVRVTPKTLRFTYREDGKLYVRDHRNDRLLVIA